MIKIVTEPLCLDELIGSVESPSSGALVIFDGRVRNHSDGKEVLYLEYEAYESMALKEMEAIRRKSLDRWTLDRVVIFHRIGRVEIGESSVLIAVSSAHRADAFSACQHIIDELKKRVPIWKKEFFADGEVWVGLQNGYPDFS